MSNHYLSGKISAGNSRSSSLCEPNELISVIITRFLSFSCSMHFALKEPSYRFTENFQASRFLPVCRQLVVDECVRQKNQSTRWSWKNIEARALFGETANWNVRESGGRLLRFLPCYFLSPRWTLHSSQRDTYLIWIVPHTHQCAYILHCARARMKADFYLDSSYFSVS